MGFLDRLLGVLTKAAPLRFWAMLGAGIVVTALCVGFALMVRYGWGTGHESQQLNFLGWALLIALTIIGVVVVALAGVTFKGTGFGGSSIEITATNSDSGTTKVTQTTEVKTVPKGDT